jgi:uncharacterized membrane protein
MQENGFINQIIVWLMGIIGTIILFSGGLVAYIFNRHVKENDREFSENRETHREIFRRLNDGKND